MRGDMESYDKLAHVGDSLLNTFITCLLHAMNPKSRPKVATDLKGKLTNGGINTHIARHYDLVSKIRTGLAAGGTFRESDDEAGEITEPHWSNFRKEQSQNSTPSITQKWRLDPPVYKWEYVWPNWVLEKDRKGNQGKVWKSCCTVYTRDGKVISREGMAEGAKGPADNVAAYLVLQDLRGANRGRY
ncbi:hypothetical protein V866_004601 [Kwoniella sp. B9012]